MGVHETAASAERMVETAEGARFGADWPNPGPTAWRNWQGPASGLPPLYRYETAFYSDAAFVGSHVEAGPYRFINTLAQHGEGGGPAIVMRTEWYLRWDVDATVEETDESRYVGGTLEDEMANLLSLATGRRMRAGGMIREWREDDDPWGRPVEHERTPQQPVGSRRPLIPSLGCEANIEEAAPLLSTYGDIVPTEAVRLARAARLYSEAVWVADADPGLAWIFLVSAVEAAATTSDRGRGAAARFRSFLLQHLPPPPEPRAPWTLVDWDAIEPSLDVVYDRRSRSLHNGRPFPNPMLQAPRWEDNLETEDPGEYARTAGWTETAFGIAEFSHDAVWASKDVPMLLWVFEHTVRGALQSWWAGLERRQAGQEALS